MKKNKTLHLSKIKIAKLENARTIIGGVPITTTITTTFRSFPEICNEDTSTKTAPLDLTDVDI